MLLLCLATQMALALDIITTDGKFYKSCSVTQVEPDALRIMHSDGAARIPYEKLPSALQKQYFDPDKVAAYREQVAAAKRAADEAAAAKAEQERRQRAIAAAQAEERRQQEEEARQREIQEQEEKERADKAAAQAAETLRQAIHQRKKTLLIAMAGVGLVLGIFLYFLPTIVGRHKANATAIFMLNLFLGWTFLGWVLALIWACTQDSAMEQLARERMNMPPPAPPRPYGTFGGTEAEEGRTLGNGGSGGRFLE
jgi:hypothetical protein